MPSIRPRTVVLTGGLIAILSAPLAGAAGEGRPVDGGERNPSQDTRRSYTRETEIIADTSTYGTRQSNKSDNGGGAIYGCRSGEGGSAKRNEPCVRAVNLKRGFAFEFESSGPAAGLITVGKGGDDVKPFTTNATGVATGLNADRVDGKNGDDLLLKTDKAADADKLDGKDAGDFAASGDLLFAAVDATGTVTAKRGGDVTATVAPATNTFTLTFSKDVSACSFTATQSGAAAADVQFAVASGGAAAPREVTVDETDGGAPVPFHLQVIC